MTHPRITPATRAAERAAMEAATAAWLEQGNQIEQVPASHYRRDHGLKIRNKRAQLIVSHRHHRATQTAG